MSQAEQSLSEAKLPCLKHYMTLHSPYSTPDLWFLPLGEQKRGSVTLEVVTRGADVGDYVLGRTPRWLPRFPWLVLSVRFPPLGGAQNLWLGWDVTLMIRLRYMMDIWQRWRDFLDGLTLSLSKGRWFWVALTVSEESSRVDILGSKYSAVRWAVS